jgi:hypothetical protein
LRSLLVKVVSNHGKTEELTAYAEPTGPSRTISHLWTFDSSRRRTVVPSGGACEHSANSLRMRFWLDMVVYLVIQLCFYQRESEVVESSMRI